MANEMTSAAAEPDKKAAVEDPITRDWLLKEIDSAEKREKDYRKKAESIVKLYEGAHEKIAQYNILYSNVDTLQPALYNSTPRPVVQRRFKSDDDTLGKVSSELVQRLLTYQLQDECPDYPTFDGLMAEATLAALLVSRGVTRFKYDAEMEPGERSDDDTGPQETEVEEPPEKITYEVVYGEPVPWNNFLHGYAKRWTQVPWVDFIHLMTPEEFKENFPDAAVDMDALASAYNQSASETSDSSSDASGAEGTGAISKREVIDVNLIPVHEVWVKKTKKVYFASSFSKEFLREPAADPLELRGYFPCNEPLNFMQRLSGLVPVCLYTMYQGQAEELNKITLRISRLILALKLRGAYDATIPELANILSADDNEMLAIADAAVLYSQNSNIERALWVMPIDKIMVVLQGLYTQRQQIKAIIFEITGIADIMRGSTQASETLGAQEIKNQWGTLRLKRLQKDVQKYVRDSMRILAELALTKLQPERIRAMTDSKLPSTEQKMQAAAAVQAAVAQGRQPDPQMMATAQMPSFDEVLAALRDDITRSYKIDIETNSTIDAEATEDKQDVVEVFNAMGQFMTGVGPLIERGIMPFEAARVMLLTVTRKFKFGMEIEDQIKRMKEPEPPPEEAKPTGPSPEQMQAEAQLAQMQSQAAMATEQAKMKALEQQVQIAEREHAMKMQELARKAELDEAKFRRDMVKLTTPAPAPAPATPAIKKS